MSMMTDEERRERRNERDRKRYAANPILYREKQRVATNKYREKLGKGYTRKWELKRKYQLDEVDYQALLAYQQGVCAICGRHPRAHMLHVDHSHKKGLAPRESVRGLLCYWCNRALEATVMAHQRVVGRSCPCPHCQYWRRPPAPEILPFTGVVPPG